MSQLPPKPHNNPDDLEALNREIEDLYVEVEELHEQTAALIGLMAGGYAYFLQQFMLAHQSSSGLSPEVCERIVIDAIKRVKSSEKRFGFDLLAEIQKVLPKMSQPIPLEPYIEKMLDQS